MTFVHLLLLLRILNTIVEFISFSQSDFLSYSRDLHMKIDILATEDPVNVLSSKLYPGNSLFLFWIWDWHDVSKLDSEMISTFAFDSSRAILILSKQFPRIPLPELICMIVIILELSMFPLTHRFILFLFLWDSS